MTVDPVFLKKSPPGPDATFIRNMFGSISQNYDRANDLITFGMARRWRRELVRWSAAPPEAKVLDCATGTGDLAIDFKEILGPKSTVVGSDFCKEMLAVAPEKAKSLELNIHFELGDVMALNYPSQQFDVTSVAYGLRNVADSGIAIRELARVTKSGGRVMILETGEIKQPVLRKLIGLYFKTVVPRIGGWVSGKREAYEYLQNSSRAFPSGEDFCAHLRATRCFARVDHRSLMGGASYIYRCVVK